MTGQRIAFIGDSHLDQGLPELPEFLTLLAGLGERCGTVVLMGDLFDLWVGDPVCQGDHHRQVVEALISLRKRGVRTCYIEGNRDYRIESVAAEAFDEIHSAGAVFEAGGRRVFAIHGDGINRSDYAYRCWRRLSRSAIGWWLFGLIPASRRARVANGLERRMRSTNQAHRNQLPEQMIRERAESSMIEGVETVVLGHFHVERHWKTRSGEVWLLPEWKSSHRHLELDESGQLLMVNSSSES